MQNAVLSFERAVSRRVASVRPPLPFLVPTKARSVVVFACTGIGSGLFCSAAIESLKRGYPDARVTVVAHHRRMAVARHHPSVDRVLPYSKSPFVRARLLVALLSARPDLVVALRLNEEAVSLGYLSNRRAFVGSRRRCKSFDFLLSKVVETPRDLHSVDEMLAIARAAGGSEQRFSMVYEVTPQEDKAVARRFSEWIESPFIVWQVGASDTGDPRVWPAELAAKAIEALGKTTTRKIVLTGGREEMQAADQIAAACPFVVKICGRTSFEETAALVRRADLLVSRDTGVMHAGVAIGTPTLALLHSAKRVRLYGPPPDDRRHHALFPEGDVASASAQPMAHLSCQAVVDRISEMLQAQPQQRMATT